MALDPSQVHAVLGIEQGVALAPPTAPSSPFMVYLAGLLADPSKVSEFAFACTFAAPLRGLCQDDFSAKFLSCATGFPCAFKSLCVTLLVWYTLVFQALCVFGPWPQMDLDRTDPADPDRARAKGIEFPFHWDTKRFHVEDGFLQRMKGAGWHGLCDWDRNFIPCLMDGCYLQLDVGCANVPGSQSNCADHGRRTEWSAAWETDADGNGFVVDSSQGADVLSALEVCRRWGDANDLRNGFLYQQHQNGHMICGFYKAPVSMAELSTAIRGGHRMGAICSVRPTEAIGSVQFGRLPLEPFLQLSLEYAAKGLSTAEQRPLRAALATAQGTADCAFDTTGEFLPARVLHQALSCTVLMLKPQSLGKGQVVCAVPPTDRGTDATLGTVPRVTG